MPRYAKTGDPRINAGHYDQPASFFTMVQTQSSTGAVDRTKTFAYTANVNVAPYEGIELQDSLRVVGETWYTLAMQYMPSRLPTEGMRVVIKRTQEELEVRGVKEIGFARAKVELTCRKLV